ncbi:MAG: hypothetical protein VB089_22775, partial [Anaerolineaceae bacterium]|nr:hypothetical protein [Anaerolineaceae bacterium]
MTTSVMPASGEEKSPAARRERAAQVLVWKFYHQRPACMAPEWRSGGPGVNSVKIPSNGPKARRGPGM